MSRGNGTPWGNQPAPVFRGRINHAIDLYRLGRVRKLIFTGAADDRSEPPEAVVGQGYALAQGVPAADMLAEQSRQPTAAGREER